MVAESEPGLIFLKYVSDAFAERRADLAGRFADSEDEYFIEDVTLRADDLEERDYYLDTQLARAYIPRAPTTWNRNCNYPTSE